MARRNKENGKLPFASLLPQLMEERGLGIRQIAEIAEVPRTVAQGWLNGHIPHDLHAVSRLSRALGVGFKKLLLGEDESPVSTSEIRKNFEEIEVLDGLCHVSIKRLIDRNGG